MAACPWREKLLNAYHANKAANHGYAQLATVHADGRPAVRTIVYRGMVTGDASSRQALRFCTDIRSTKIADLHSSNAGELCWYFPITREQFRLSGRLHLVTAPTHAQQHAALLPPSTLLGPDGDWESQRLASWAHMSPQGRAGFAGATPGAELDPAQSDQHSVREIRIEPDGATGSSEINERALSNYCLLLLEVNEVDHLMLKRQPQERHVYAIRGAGDQSGWTSTRVNP